MSRKGYEQFDREMNFTAADNLHNSICDSTQDNNELPLAFQDVSGMGQFYHERPVMGTFLSVAFIAAAAVTVQLQIDYSSKVSAYTILLYKNLCKCETNGSEHCSG